MTDRDDDRLRAHVERLARDVPPPRDLWPGVSRGIHAARRRALVVRIAVPVATLAAAAAVLLLVGGGRPHRPSTSYATETPVSASAPASAPAPAPGVAAPAPPLPGEVEYERAEHVLAADLDARRTVLGPSQTATLDESMRVLDRAIEATRAAVREHPDDPELRADLDLAWQDKLDMLRQVNELTAEK